MNKVNQDDTKFRAFVQSGTFPDFFGMAMPLLKYGLPVRPVLLDNARRYPGYLDDYKTLILSYEYIKPESPDVNNALAAWVKAGGTLVYIGDGSDPYHCIDGWWNRNKDSGEGSAYENPAQHLFEMLELPLNPENGVNRAGNGIVMVWNISPSRLCLNTEVAEEYRTRIKELLALRGSDWQYGSTLTLRRGPYIISAVMDETGAGRKESKEGHSFKGLFADMFANDYAIITEKQINPDENTILFDFSKIEGEDWRIIGCSARVFSLDSTDDGSAFTMKVKAADKIKAFIRIRLPKAAASITAEDEKGNPVEMDYAWDEASQTALLRYDSTNQTLLIKGLF